MHVLLSYGPASEGKWVLHPWDWIHTKCHILSLRFLLSVITICVKHRLENGKGDKNFESLVEMPCTSWQAHSLSYVHQCCFSSPPAPLLALFLLTPILHSLDPLIMISLPLSRAYPKLGNWHVVEFGIFIILAPPSHRPNAQKRVGVVGCCPGLQPLAYCTSSVKSMSPCRSKTHHTVSIGTFALYCSLWAFSWLWNSAQILTSKELLWLTLYSVQSSLEIMLSDLSTCCVQCRVWSGELSCAPQKGERSTWESRVPQCLIQSKQMAGPSHLAGTAPCLGFDSSRAGHQCPKLCAVNQTWWVMFLSDVGLTAHNHYVIRAVPSDSVPDLPFKE